MAERDNVSDLRVRVDAPLIRKIKRDALRKASAIDGLPGL